MNLKYILYKLVPRYRSIPFYKRSCWLNIYKKIRYGFDDVDLFSLDYHLTKLIYPRIRAFREQYEANPFNVPSDFLWHEQQYFIRKGAKWNKQWARLDDKNLNQTAWDKAIAKWIQVLKMIEEGFEDYLLEEEDWNAWRDKWAPEVKYMTEKLEKAKTAKKKEEIWDSIHTWRKYYPGILVTVDDVCYSCRQEAKRLLFEHYNKLWR